jgi:multiple sugar transport system substrate-binding protein
MKRRDCLKAIGGGALAATGVPAAAAADRYAKYKGATIVVNWPAHPHYDAAARLVPEFTRETGIKVEIDRMQYLRMHDKQLLEMSKPKGDYDVISYVVFWKAEYVKKGLLQPLSPFLGKAGLADPAYDIADIVPGYLENIGLVGGKKGYLAGAGAQLYGIPFGAETSILAYRKDIFDKHGLKPPATYDELAKLLPVLKAKEPGMGALTSRGQSGSHVVHAWLLHLNPLGGKIFDDLWRPVFQLDAGVQAARLLKQISDSGPAGIPGYGFGEMSNAFLQGQAAMYLDTIAIFGQVEDPAKSKIAGKVAYALHPKGTRSSSETGGFGMAIPRNAANSEAAFLFIEWMTNKVNDKRVTGLGGNATRMSTLGDAELLKRYPQFHVLREQLKYADPDWRPIIPEWSEINEQVLGVGLSEVLIGKKSAEDALRDMAPKVAAIMRAGGYLKA